MSVDSNERVYSIALVHVPGIGHIGAKRLVEGMGSATAVFEQREDIPLKVPLANKRVVEALDCPQAFSRAEREFEFACDNGIRVLAFHDDDYPFRLRSCEDAPVVLFYKGMANLNAARVINIVGTRRTTDYGKGLCASFVKDIKDLCPDMLIVSGLAYGIDIAAHREALANGLSTVGVLAHGLDRIYPYVHRKTAVDMLGNGGLLTEFSSGTNPDKFNFISRNRIIAGMCDATIVVESALKGGSLITADLALGYGRDCFAFPGRVGDTYSCGCNGLIGQNKAALLQNAEDLFLAMGWQCEDKLRVTGHTQVDLPFLTPEEQVIVKLLEQYESLQINSLVVMTDIPVQKMSAMLFELEMKNVVRQVVGGLYKLAR